MTAPREPLIYSDSSVKVSASWLQLEHDSIAIRFVKRMRLSSVHPPRRAGIALCVIAVLALLVVLITEPATDRPTWLTVFLLLLCVSAAAWASYVAFVMRSWHSLTVTLADGSDITVRKTERERLKRIRDALAVAVDRHRSTSVPDDSRARRWQPGAGQNPGQPSRVQPIGSNRLWIDPEREEGWTNQASLPSLDNPPPPPDNPIRASNKAARARRIASAIAARFASSG